jgi:hypothetical protein
MIAVIICAADMGSRTINKIQVQVLEKQSRTLFFEKKSQRGSMVLRYQHYFAGNVTVEQAAVGYTPGATQPDSGSLPVLLAVSLRARKKT